MGSGSELTIEYRACYSCSAVNKCTESFCPACGKPLLLNQHYEVIEEVKTGAMGCIFKAGERTRKRTVALKQMLTSIEDSSDRDYSERRFREEASILSELHHGGLPEVFDFFRERNPVTKEEEHYLAMTFITGMTLEAVIMKHDSEPFPIDEAMDYFMQLLNILCYLHCHKPPVLHRDLNPRNCMLQNGIVFLVDFGIARIFVPHQKGTAIGTPGYAPPEQYHGFVDQRSDIYSLGVIMHYLLTGQNPEASGKSPFNFDNVMKHNPKIPKVIARLITSMVEVIPDKRPPSVGNIKNTIISSRANRFGRYAGSVRKRFTSALRDSTASLGKRVTATYNEITKITGDRNTGTSGYMLPEAAAPSMQSSRPQYSYSTIYEAAKKNDLDAVMDYIDKGADINERDSDGSLLLHEAIMQGNREITEFLLSRGADIISVDKNGWTPVHCAVRSDSKEIVELLILHGAHIDIQDNYGLTPAALAGYHGSTEAIKVLNMHPSLRKPRRDHRIFNEIEKNELNAVIELTATGVSLNIVNENGETLLHKALATGNEDIAEFLISKGAKLDTRNEFGRTPLHIAAEKNQCISARLIIINGGKVDIQDNFGFTPLHIAAKHDHQDIAELLISHGADVKQKDRSGKNPLDMAKLTGSMEMVMLLTAKQYLP